MLLAAAVLTLTLCIGAFAAEKTVYIASSGDDAKDGTFYRNAVKTVKRAYELIGEEDGKVVVCNYLSVGGACIAETQENSIGISGKYTLNITGGNYPRIASVKGSDTVTLSRQYARA